MAESNYLHGTNIKFDIGQVILPAKKAGVESNYDEFIDMPGMGRVPMLEGLSEHAFATGDEQEALKAADKAVRKKGTGEARVYRVSPVDVEDLDFDPNSSSQSGIRSKSGFRVEEEISTNNIRNLRFDIDGKAYFLHYSTADLKVGESILPSGSLQVRQSGKTGDAMAGMSYSYDALDPRSIDSSIYSQTEGILLNEGTDSQRRVKRIYLTRAPVDNIGIDINIVKESVEDDGLIKALTDNNYRAVFGSQEIIDRVDIPFIGSNNPELYPEARNLVEELLRKNGIIQNSPEEQELVNMALSISKRTVQDVENYNDLRIKTRINDFINFVYEDGLPWHAQKGQYQNWLDTEKIPFLEAIKDKDAEKAFSLRKSYFGDIKIEESKTKAVISALKTFEESTGVATGKEAVKYGRAEMSMAKRTLHGILEAGRSSCCSYEGIS